MCDPHACFYAYGNETVTEQAFVAFTEAFAGALRHTVSPETLKEAIAALPRYRPGTRPQLFVDPECPNHRGEASDA